MQWMVMKMDFVKQITIENKKKYKKLVSTFVSLVLYLFLIFNP